MKKKRKIINKIKVIIICIITSFASSGCWDYVSLDQLTIVTGMAIDLNNTNQKYHAAFEIIDLTISNKQEGVKSTIVESEGKTIFDAVRNAKKKINNKLYFSHMQVALINEEIARKDNIDNIINWFLRDAELRETISFIVVKDCLAIDILNKKGIGHPIISYEIKKIVEDDNKVTSSTASPELYKLYNFLNSEDHSLVLPVFHPLKNNNEPSIESDGIAVFSKNKLLGFLSSEESKYFLFATDKIKGGILTVDAYNDDKNRLSLEIERSTTKRKYTYKNEKIKMTLFIETHVYLAEGKHQGWELSQEKLKEFEKKAAKQLNKEIEKTISKVQKQFASDIFGFGNFIYEKNPQLWKKIKYNWPQLFSSMDVEVKSTVKIDNTAFIK